MFQTSLDTLSRVIDPLGSRDFGAPLPGEHTTVTAPKCGGHVDPLLLLLNLFETDSLIWRILLWGERLSTRIRHDRVLYVARVRK